jgi:hypothetical protein
LGRLARSLPRQSSFSWQRSVLLVCGGAILAYGLTGGARRRQLPTVEPRQNEVTESADSTVPQIERMTRAPLRFEPVTTPADQPTPSRSTSQDLFQLPETQIPKSRGVADEAAPRPTPEPAGEFPVIGAPDGSALSRRIDPLPGPDQIRPAETQGLMQALSHRGSTPEPPLALSTKGPRPSTRGPAPSEQYPHTNPATYRDPIYEIPSTAVRARGRSR